MFFFFFLMLNYQNAFSLPFGTPGIDGTGVLPALEDVMLTDDKIESRTSQLLL